MEAEVTKRDVDGLIIALREKLKFELDFHTNTYPSEEYNQLIEGIGVRHMTMYEIIKKLRALEVTEKRLRKFLANDELFIFCKNNFLF